MRVVVFNEGFHERTEPDAAARYHPHIRQTIGNAVRWAAPTGPVIARTFDDEAPLGWWSV